NGKRRTSTTRSTPDSRSSAMNSSALRVEWPMVKTVMHASARSRGVARSCVDGGAGGGRRTPPLDGDGARRLRPGRGGRVERADEDAVRRQQDDVAIDQRGKAAILERRDAGIVGERDSRGMGARIEDQDEGFFGPGPGE